MTRKERRLWIAVGVAVAALFLSLYPLQIALDFLRERNLLRLSIGASFLAVVLIVAVRMFRRRFGPREWAVLCAAGAIYLLVAAWLDVPQERLHLVEYGGLALLLRAAFAERERNRADEPGEPRQAPGVAAKSLVAAGSIGLVDELVQGVLPNRQYDTRDVALNLVAAALALAVATSLERARYRREP